MSNDPQQAAMNFWYELDNLFAFGVSPAQSLMTEMFQGTKGELGTYYAWQQAYAAKDQGKYPSDFVKFADPWKPNLTAIFEQIDVLLIAHFGTSAEAQQSAFELFGQGTLWDRRRDVPGSPVPEGQCYNFIAIHSMDADYSKDQPPVGYYSWYSFLRAFVLTTGATDPKWLTLGRNIALAGAVQQWAKPKDILSAPTNPQNPPIDPAELEKFRAAYLGLDFDGLDAAFFSDPDLGPPPPPQPERALLKFAKLPGNH